MFDLMNIIKTVYNYLHMIELNIASIIYTRVLLNDWMMLVQLTHYASCIYSCRILCRKVVLSFVLWCVWFSFYHHL